MCASMYTDKPWRLTLTQNAIHITGARLDKPPILWWHTVDGPAKSCITLVETPTKSWDVYHHLSTGENRISSPSTVRSITNLDDLIELATNLDGHTVQRYPFFRHAQNHISVREAILSHPLWLTIFVGGINHQSMGGLWHCLINMIYCFKSPVYPHCIPPAPPAARIRWLLDATAGPQDLGKVRWSKWWRNMGTPPWWNP